MPLNMNTIIEELLAFPASPTAREAAAPLIEGWIEQYMEDDASVRTVAVECGFTIWLDPDTLIIGVQDRIAADNLGAFGCEWKTTKEPKRNKDGSDSAWWNEDVWLKELVNGPQLAIYALAMHKGTYYPKGKEDAIVLGVDNPRILVRAAVKSNPPRFWPSDPTASVFQFPNEMLPSVENALLVRAAQIRAARASALLPWQLPGKHCISFNRECQYAEACRERRYAISDSVNVTFNENDPAHQLSLSRIDPKLLTNPNLVILSASAYSDSCQCMEKYRLLNIGGAKDESLALETGGCFHAGIAAYYKQMQADEVSPVTI